jgi:hypothetical protein
MKNSRTMIMSAFLVIAAAASASAQTATQDLTISVQAINKIAVSGGAHTLTVNTATAGNAPDDATWTTSWAVTTNESDMKITASIGSAMPSGVTLKVNLANPANAASAGAVTLDDGSAKDVVTGITKLNEGSLPLTYTVQATTEAGVQSVSKTVTYTITSGV